MIRLSPLTISASLHVAIAFFVTMVFVFSTRPREKLNIEVRVIEKPQAAPVAVDLTQPPPVQEPPPPSRRVFGLTRKALTREASDPLAPTIKGGNTLATAPDKEKLQDSDADALPIPVEEYLITKPPSLIQARKPLYPPLARERGIQGAVRIEILIDAEGRVRDARVLSGLGFGTEEAALEAARQLRFTPAEISGQPVAVKIQFKINFELE
jgi:TonB family protein